MRNDSTTAFPKPKYCILPTWYENLWLRMTEGPGRLDLPTAFINASGSAFIRVDLYINIVNTDSLSVPSRQIVFSACCILALECGESISTMGLLYLKRWSHSAYG